MSILSQLKDKEEKIIGGYPMNGNIYSIDEYNDNNMVNILDDTDYNISFKRENKNQCLCIDKNNKLSFQTCGTDNCKFKIKSEVPDNNYNDTNESIRGESYEGIIVNLTYNDESSDKNGKNMLNLTNYSSSAHDIIMEIAKPGIKCYVNNDYINIRENEATLNDIYRNNQNSDSIDLYCYISIKKDNVKHYLKINNTRDTRDILFEQMKNPTSWVLRFIKTDSRFNKCYILNKQLGKGNRYLSKTNNNALELTNNENNATLFNFRVKNDIDNNKFLFINNPRDPNNNLISLRSYNNHNDDTQKLYNLKFNLKVEKNGESGKKQIRIEDTILVNDYKIVPGDLLNETVLSKKIRNAEYDINSKYNNNYKFLVDITTFRIHLDELKLAAKSYRNLIRNINNIEGTLLKPFIVDISNLMNGTFSSINNITALFNSLQRLKKNYEDFSSAKDPSKNNNTFLESLSNAILDEEKIEFLIGINKFNNIGLLQFASFFKDKAQNYYESLFIVYLLDFDSSDMDNLPKIFTDNKIPTDLKQTNIKFLETNKNNLHKFNSNFEKFKDGPFDLVNSSNTNISKIIDIVKNISGPFINNVTRHSYYNIKYLYDNFDNIKSKINKMNGINFGFSIGTGGINNLREFYSNVYAVLEIFGMIFIRSALPSGDELSIIMDEIFQAKGEPIQSGDYINIRRVEYFVKLYKNIYNYNNNTINNKITSLIKELSFENYSNKNEINNGIVRIYYFKVLKKFFNDIYTNNKDAISHLSVSIQSETMAYSTGLAGTSSHLPGLSESFKEREGFDLPKPKNFLKEKNTLKHLLNNKKMIYYTNLDGLKVQVDDIEDYTDTAFIKNQNIIDNVEWSDDYSNHSKYNCAVDDSVHNFLANYSYKCLGKVNNKLKTDPVSLNYNDLDLGTNCTEREDPCSFNYKCKLVIHESSAEKDPDTVFLKLFNLKINDNINQLNLISLNDYNITKKDLVNFDDCLNLANTTSFKNDNVINTNILPKYNQISDEINSLCSISDIIDTSINSIEKLNTLYERNKNSSGKHYYLTTHSNKMCLIIRNGKFKLIYVTKKKKKINNESTSRISGEHEHSSQIINNDNPNINEFYLYNNPNYTSNDEEKLVNNISKFGYVDIKGQFHKLDDGLIYKKSISYNISNTKYCLDDDYKNPTKYSNCDDTDNCLGRLSIKDGCATTDTTTGTSTDCYMIGDGDIKNLYISHDDECVTSGATGAVESGQFEQKKFSIKRDSSDINSYSHITNAEKTHTITNTKYLELMNHNLSSDNFDTSSFLNNISNSMKEKYDTLRNKNTEILKNLIDSYNELNEEEINIINKSTEMKEDLQTNILENYKKNIDNINKANKYINLEEGRENQYRNLKSESDYKLALMGILSITSVIMLLHYTKK